MQKFVSFFDKKYPLIKLFAYGDDVLLYDAKPHFACILSLVELSVLVDFLEKKNEAFLVNKYAASLNEETLKKLIEKFTELLFRNVFQEGPINEISPVDRDKIKNTLEYFDKNILLRKFCIEVTENCNFRCTYCKRTTEEDYRGHMEYNLNASDAFKGIDYYFKKYIDFYTQLSEKNKRLLLEIVPPSISWYGGEPFLNFDLIKKTSEYFKNLPWQDYAIDKTNLKFTSNTNLSVMTDEVLHFLVENNVHLFASLDGPQEEHDKCRVLKNGDGSFHVAFENLMKIKNFNEDYFNKKVSIFGVYTKGHDYEKCVMFTNSLGVSKCQHFPADCSGVFVNDFVEAEHNRYGSVEAELEAFKEKIMADSNSDEKRMLNYLHLLPFAKINYDYPAGKDCLDLFITCPMGFDNLMLTARGDYLICHKVNNSMPVGNCDTGIDFDKLMTLNTEYNSAVNNDECKNCWNVHFCTLCAASRMVGDKFINPTKKECDYFRKRMEFNFMCFIYLSMNYPDLLNKIFEFRNDIRKYIGIIDRNEFDKAVSLLCPV
ncbi:MAG: radical SAM protein [Chlorobiaceae bacterium]|nr:radical SAM protein [Chlorobiaceae bacterium]